MDYLGQFEYHSGRCAQDSVCPRSEPHDVGVQDHLSHYLGCVEYRDRMGFFDENGQQFQIEYRRLSQQISRAGEIINAYTSNLALSETRLLMDEWKQECLEHFRRIQHIRQSLGQDLQECHLIQAIHASYKMWICSDEYRQGLPAVRAWRQGDAVAAEPKRNDSTPNVVFGGHTPAEPYDPEKLTKASIIHIFDKRAVQVDMLPANFTQQTISVHDLLFQDGINVASRKNKPEKIRYIHLPSNNMAWVESLISRYYVEGELGMERNGGETAAVSRRVLSHENWHGQQLGGSNSISRLLSPRSMRPLCKPIQDGSSPML